MTFEVKVSAASTEAGRSWIRAALPPDQKLGGTQVQLPDSGSVFYFEFRALIDAFAQAQARWLLSYNTTPAKFEVFVQRYDETVSDGRLAHYKIAP